MKNKKVTNVAIKKELFTYYILHITYYILYILYYILHIIYYIFYILYFIFLYFYVLFIIKIDNVLLYILSPYKCLTTIPK